MQEHMMHIKWVCPGDAGAQVCAGLVPHTGDGGIWGNLPSGAEEWNRQYEGEVPVF